MPQVPKRIWCPCFHLQYLSWRSVFKTSVKRCLCAHQPEVNLDSSCWRCLCDSWLRSSTLWTLCPVSATGVSLGCARLGIEWLHHRQEYLHLYYVCHTALTVGTPSYTHPGEYKTSRALRPHAILGIVRFHHSCDLMRVSDISLRSLVTTEGKHLFVVINHAALVSSSVDRFLLPI